MVNVKSTVNLTGIANSSYNQKFTVTGISSARTFVVGLTTDPGTFNNDTSARTTLFHTLRENSIVKLIILTEVKNLRSMFPENKMVYII
ncbi:MAG: hypothetical protein CM15mV12_3110 [uncultured marine virus]|nr:MAG: hypothetical protein CM15mV12_3110 [uncultured marine virus]